MRGLVNLMGYVIVNEVQEHSVQTPFWQAIGVAQTLMHAGRVVVSLTARIEARHPIWVHGRAANVAPKTPAEPVELIDRWPLGHRVQNTGLQLRCDPLIGVDGQNPVTGGQRFGTTALDAKAIPVSAHFHPCTGGLDRKSTRLNSSHVAISYAVFCLKKKNTQN